MQVRKYLNIVLLLTLKNTIYAVLTVLLDVRLNIREKISVVEEPMTVVEIEPILVRTVLRNVTVEW